MIRSDDLLQLLPTQRWFGGKGRGLTSVEVIDQATVDDGPPRLCLVLARAGYPDGGEDLYHLPLLVEDDGSIRDVLADPHRLGALGPLMAHGEGLRGEFGSFQFGGPGLDPLSPPGKDIRALSTEQSNSSVVLDDTYIVKLFRRIQVGVNPDLELNRLLTNEGFENIPPHVGEIAYEGEINGEEAYIDLGIAQQYLGDGKEGWVETLQRLHGLYDFAGDGDDIDEAVVRHAERSLEELEDLGNVSASLHVLLCREELEPDIASEPIDSQDLKEWAERARWSLDQLLGSGVSELEPYRDAIHERIDALVAIDDPGLKTRVHGDYHLGQVMLNPRGWFILDFEGEPMRTLEERRAKQSPMRDVAGMLRSFSYAATVAMFERTEPDSDEYKRLQPWADAWEAAARERFISAYHRTALEAEFMPSDRESFETLLEVFELDKALYELGYERGHRPGWERIPLRGIARLVGDAAR